MQSAGGPQAGAAKLRQRSWNDAHKRSGERQAGGGQRAERRAEWKGESRAEEAAHGMTPVAGAVTGREANDNDSSFTNQEA